MTCTGFYFDTSTCAYACPTTVDPNTVPVSPNPIDPNLPNPGDFGTVTPVDTTPHHCVNKEAKTTAGYVATQD
jgi:hypothetical protein